MDINKLKDMAVEKTIEVLKIEGIKFRKREFSEENTIVINRLGVTIIRCIIYFDDSKRSKDMKKNKNRFIKYFNVNVLKYGIFFEYYVKELSSNLNCIEEYNGNKLLHGDCIDKIKNIPSQTIDCCITSPPYYGLRDYGIDGQIGLESTPSQYIDKLVEIFREVYRVLKPEGTLWINIGDSYVGTGGDRKKPVNNELFNMQQANNPNIGRYLRT